jgi:hypothetical protein
MKLGRNPHISFPASYFPILKCAITKDTILRDLGLLTTFAVHNHAIMFANNHFFTFSITLKWSRKNRKKHKKSDKSNVTTVPA